MIKKTIKKIINITIDNDTLQESCTVTYDKRIRPCPFKNIVFKSNP